MEREDEEDRSGVSRAKPSLMNVHRGHMKDNVFF